MSAMSITNERSFRAAFTAGSKAKSEDRARAVCEFAFGQLRDHSNATPLTYLYNNMNALAGRPKGMTRKNLKDYAENYLAATLDKKSKVFRVNKKANMHEPEPKFWTLYASTTSDGPKPVNEVLPERIGNLAKRAKQEGMSLDDFVDVVSKAASTVYADE